MKFADLLSVAKNIPLSSFDWGQDAVMYLNRRLCDEAQVSVEMTGMEIHGNLLSLNPTEMIELLGRSVEVNGTRLDVTDNVTVDSTPMVAPAPTHVPEIVTDPVSAPVQHIEVEITRPPSKWPMIVAALIVTVTLGATFAITSGSESLESKENRGYARTTLQVMLEILRTINGSPSSEVQIDDPYEEPRREHESYPVYPNDPSTPPPGPYDPNKRPDVAPPPQRETERPRGSAPYGL